MKLKFYLRGLGIGILFSTIILSTSFRVSSKTQMTDAEIMEKAEELGMTKIEENNVELDDLLKTTIQPTEAPTTEPTISPVIEPTVIPTLEPTIIPTIGPTAKPTVVPTLSPTTIPSKTTSKEDKDTNNSENEVKYVTFEVNRGMTSEKVASVLADRGVIQDEKSFNIYLIHNGYASIIRLGKYEIAIDASYEQIADIITSK